MELTIGQVYYVNLIGEWNTQGGYRPCVIFQNNIGNKYSPNVVVLPLTSSLKKLHQPTHVLLPMADTGLKTDSMVLCENPVCVPKSKIGAYVTTIQEEYMREIAMAYMIASSAITFVPDDALVTLKHMALRANAAY